MILIADSGSTKTSWFYSDKKNKGQHFVTSGINPFFRSSNDIARDLNKNLVPQLKGKVERVFYYGAGIINTEKGNVVRSALLHLFPEAIIEVRSDLFAAARATLGTENGIACILGTGSNSGLFIENERIEHVPPLGFILGDEGSGAVLGRKLVADYLKGIMPGILAEKFKKQFPYEYSEFLEKVYKQEKPNKFLAGFVPFLVENINSAYCKKLVEQEFERFIQRNLFQYSNYKNQKICFVGSVAYYFKEQLKIAMEKNKLNLGIVLKEPMVGLIRYHFKTNFQ